VLGDMAGALPPDQALLVVGCFGSLRVHTRTEPGGALHDLTGQLSPKHRLLISCMVSRPNGVPTADLLESGWPDASFSTAQRRLSATLTPLRRVLREAIGAPRARLATHVNSRYTLAPVGVGEELVWVDYWAFLAAAATARAHTGNPRIQAHQQLTALYGGILLPELDTHWIEAARVEAQREAITAFARLAEHHQHSDPDRAVALLQVALEHDHTHRATATQLIRLHQHRNQPDAAHHVYTQLAAQLAAAGLPGPDQTTTEALHTRPIPTGRSGGTSSRPSSDCRPDSAA
jgi:DNA-binding SARP family transcriptional activator